MSPYYPIKNGMKSILLLALLLCITLASCYNFEDFNILTEEQDLEFTESEPTLGYDESFVQDNSSEVLEQPAPVLESQTLGTDIPAEILEELKVLNQQASALNVKSVEVTPTLETKPLDAKPLDVPAPVVTAPPTPVQSTAGQHIDFNPLRTA
jgi:hypothetical protein